MPDLLPLFPLGTVLLPGALLPLHVFEDRYRVLVGELLERPAEERLFGVVAIRQGREVGEEGVSALHEVGCAAQLVRAARHEDGRYDVVTTGVRRFRLDDVARGRPYLRGEVTWLDDVAAEPAAPSGAEEPVRRALAAYLAALGRASGQDLEVPELPGDPVALSWAVADTVLLDLAERQALLAEPDAGGRLRAELALLRRETALLRAFSTAPATDLLRARVDPN